MTNEEFLKDICPNHTDKSKWNKSELLHILDKYQALQLQQGGVSGSFPHQKCDNSCYYHCTRNGQQLPDCCKNDKLYSENDLVDSAKYGYEYHATTSFPDKTFENNCKNNFLQHLFAKFGKNYLNIYAMHK